MSKAVEEKKRKKERLIPKRESVVDGKRAFMRGPCHKIVEQKQITQNL